MVNNKKDLRRYGDSIKTCGKLSGNGLRSDSFLMRISYSKMLGIDLTCNGGTHGKETDYSGRDSQTV
jgi:hypothetical protein